MLPNRTVGLMRVELKRGKTPRDKTAEKSRLAMAVCTTSTIARTEEASTSAGDEGGDSRVDHHGPLSQHMLTAFHAAVVLYYIAVDVQMFTSSKKLKNTGHPVTSMFLGGVTQFFTDWNQAIHHTYFAVSLAHDVLGYSGSKKHALARRSLAYFKRCLFGPVLLPASFLTAVNFWGLYSVIPHYMLDELVAFYPSFLNHAMHTLILPLVWAELLATPHQPLPRRQALRYVTALMASYSGWIYLLGVLTGQWPYRFLEVMTLKQHVVFIPGMFAHGYFWYFLNDLLIHKIWDGRNKKHEILKKK